MRHIWADVKRAVFSRSFLLAALGMALCLAIGGFQDLYRLFRMDWPEALFGYHEELFLRCLEGELVLFAVPILSAVPYTSAFVEDVKSGYLKPYLTRTTVDRYIWGKGLGAALSGGLALAAGMALALFLFWLLCAPVEVYGEWAVPSKLPEIGLRLVLFFLSGECGFQFSCILRRFVSCFPHCPKSVRKPAALLFQSGCHFLKQAVLISAHQIPVEACVPVRDIPVLFPVKRLHAGAQNALLRGRFTDAFFETEALFSGPLFLFFLLFDVFFCRRSLFGEL